MRFAIATREELWVRGRRLESRLSHGEAVAFGRELRATDARDDTLVAACEERMEQMRSAIASHHDVHARLVAEAGSDGASSIIVITTGSISVITTPEWIESDLGLLREAGSGEAAGHAVETRGVPILWKNGSAAVLLHEAAGHPAEHGHPPIAWPAWLAVRDGEADLLAGQPPERLRRATFRDVPMRRMSDLRGLQAGAPWELPARRIEILLVEGGTYEPLTEHVTIGVAAANLVEERDGWRCTRLAPFTIRETRSGVARAIIGATGPPLRYPGVVCSREGQELFVESWAPLLMTVFR